MVRSGLIQTRTNSVEHPSRHGFRRLEHDLLGIGLPDVYIEFVRVSRVRVVFSEPVRLGGRVSRAGVPAAEVPLPDNICGPVGAVVV